MINTATSTLLILLITTLGQSQKNDYNWISGPPSISLPDMENQIHFSKNTDTLRFSSISLPIGMGDGQISISSLDGILQFYTNGNVIASHDHQVMPNGRGLNPDSPWRDLWNTDAGYVAYTYMVLPDKRNDGIYYLLHSTVRLPQDRNYGNVSSQLLITKINMNLRDGLGDVEYKNRVLFNESTSIRFGAIQHGNGLDWWILVKDITGSWFHSLLLQEDQIISSEKQLMPIDSTSIKDRRDSILTAVYTPSIAPSGEFLIDYEGKNFRRVIDFDRCTGQLDLIRKFFLEDDTVTTINGTRHLSIKGESCISPNDRFFYTGSVAGYWQYDLESPDIEGSEVQLSTIPYVLTPQNQDTIPNQVYIATLVNAPNGKIYALFRHNHYVIHNPNEKGEAANFCDNPCLGRNIYFDSPWYPNYRLGPLKGSPCDTIITHTTDWSANSEIKIYPNPSSGPFTIEIDLPEWNRQDISAQLFDTHGRLILTHTFPPYAYIHQVEDMQLPAGIYLIKLYRGEEVLRTERLIVN